MPKELNSIYHLKLITYQSNEYQQMIALRSKILRKPLGLSFKKEDLTIDENEILIGLFSTDKLVGCVQLRPIDKKKVKLRQMAVDNNYQKQGLGKKLMSFAEKQALSLGYSIIELHARKTASDFYKKLQYKIVSDQFEEVGIPHVKMIKKLNFS